MVKFKVYFLIFFCIIVPMILAGCGTIKGIGNDISVVGEILRRV